jgi:GxxExxY protein
VDATEEEEFDRGDAEDAMKKISLTAGTQRTQRKKKSLTAGTLRTQRKKKSYPRRHNVKIMSFLFMGLFYISINCTKNRVMTENELATIVLDSAFEVHRCLGPGLLESSYEECLFFELKQSGLYVEKQKVLPLIYKEVKLDIGYRIDLLVENKLVIEIKAVDSLHDVHLAQILTYLKLSSCKLGLLINFNVALLKSGIKRVVNNL